MNDDYTLDELFSDNNEKLDSNDSIAEPFYHFIGRIFQLKGTKNWFRKSLILFVQLTYGATINRKIREFIYYLFSEEMSAYCLKMFKDSFWKLNSETETMELIEAVEQSPRTQSDKLKTKNLAKTKLIANIPGI
jgi:hypothetical protein